MSKLLTELKIQKIKLLRERGWSLPEIQKKLRVSRTTIYRYVKDVEISGEYYKIWFRKRGGSIKRKRLAEEKAKINAQQLIIDLSKREKIIFISALYWGERE